MKNISMYCLGLCLLMSLFVIGGCSKSQDSTAAASTCSTGYVYSSTYGCLAQSSCSAGYGLYNNSCVLLTSAVGTCSSGYVYNSTYGCLAQSTCPAGYGLYNNSCVAGTVSTTVGTCSAGYVYSSVYGCLAQSTCPSGYGVYGNQCVALASTASSLICPTGYANVNNTCVVSGVTTTVGACQGTCSAGYTQTTYGCLPQYKCQSCYGYTNGYCLAPTGYSYYIGY